MCAIPVAALLWAIIGFIDIHAVAPGRIQPKGYSKVVQVFEAGRVDKILVEDGQHVEQGALLIQLDDRETAADLGRLQADIADTKAEILRRRAAVEAVRQGAAKLGPIPQNSGLPEAALARE